MTKEKQKMNKTEENTISIVTGEIIDSKNVALENIGIIEDEIKALKKNKKQIKAKVGLDKPKPIQQTRFFYKLYKNEWEMFEYFSMPTFKVLKFFEMHMDYKSNTVMVDNVHMTYKDMAIYCNIGYNQFKKAIKELRDSNIIHTDRKGKYTIVTIIPFYMEDSMTSELVYKRCRITPPEK